MACMTTPIFILVRAHSSGALSCVCSSSACSYDSAACSRKWMLPLRSPIKPIHYQCDDELLPTGPGLRGRSCHTLRQLNGLLEAVCCPSRSRASRPHPPGSPAVGPLDERRLIQLQRNTVRSNDQLPIPCPIYWRPGSGRPNRSRPTCCLGLSKRHMNGVPRPGVSSVSA